VQKVAHHALTLVENNEENEFELSEHIGQRMSHYMCKTIKTSHETLNSLGYASVTMSNKIKSSHVRVPLYML